MFNLILGGMQDYNYMNSNCFEITLELSCCKYPPESQLPEEWQNNKEALLLFMEQVNKPHKWLYIYGKSVDIQFQ